MAECAYDWLQNDGYLGNVGSVRDFTSPFLIQSHQRCAAAIGPALADITGPARVIDGDTIEIAGERAELSGWAQRVPLLLIRTAITPRGYESMALSCRVRCV